MNGQPGKAGSGTAQFRLQVDPGLSLPAGADVGDWVMATVQALESRGQGVPGTVGIRILGRGESEALNRDYRGKPVPTNVLSFPAPAVPGLPPDEAPAYLGDLAICLPLVEEQAAGQGKTVRAHLAHMVVHGLLHLSGYDHESEPQAREMEKLEVDVLQGLGFPDPYVAKQSTQQ